LLALVGKGGGDRPSGKQAPLARVRIRGGNGVKKPCVWRGKTKDRVEPVGKKKKRKKGW